MRLHGAPFFEEDRMKRILTLAGFLVAAAGALSIGCAKKEATTTTETSTTREVPNASGTPEATTNTTTSTVTVDVTPTPHS